MKANSKTVKSLSELPRPKDLMVRSEGLKGLPPVLGSEETVVPEPDDAAFEAGGGDGVVRVFRQHRGKILDMAISPDGKYLCTTSITGETYIFDMQTGKASTLILTPAQPILCVAFSEKPQYLFTLRDGRINESITIRHPQDGQRAKTGIRIIETFGAPPKDLAVSPDARTLFGTWKDGNALLWRLDPVEETSRAWTFSSFLSRDLAGDKARAAGFTRDGTEIMIGMDSGIVSAWSGSGKTLSLDYRK